ncbi:MAG TPA: hypothetical protein VMH24_06035 [Candidatus Sulfotelmatobacter sp.]|nr:hypothetical protein [Candidatus Sulfotelmatobacter sp.]
MKRRTALVVGLVAAALLLIIPGSVLANTNEPIASTGGMSATLPLMGTSMAVDISLDTVGVIKTVDVNPLNGMTETKTDPGYVRFATADGKTTVSVLARGGRLALTERTTLDNLKGSGSWSADVFGTKAKSTVDYTVGIDASGNPTLTLGAIDPASGITATADAPKAKSIKTKFTGGWSVATDGVTFTWDGWTKHLSISVSAKSDGTASLRLVLSGKDRQRTTGTLAQLAGARTWSAHLCDATPVSVTYHVAADGTIVYDSATGGTVTEKSKDGWLFVRFNGTFVGMVAHLKSEGSGTYKLVVQGFSGFCGHSDKTGHDKGHGGSGGNEGWAPGGDRPH